MSRKKLIEKLYVIYSTTEKYADYNSHRPFSIVREGILSASLKSDIL